MDDLFSGVIKFNQSDYLEHKELFQKLSSNQTPHTLFISCSDSRIVPNLITKTLPGELFVIRNLANIVPPYRDSEDFLATTSAIEYAVTILQVENILICGHSNCGGCNALYLDEETLGTIPHTRKWLELAQPAKEKIKTQFDDHVDQHKREWMTEQLNIIEQMNHLMSYPVIKERYKKHKIKILGWYYIIETGEVFNYEKSKRSFVKIE